MQFADRFDGIGTLRLLLLFFRLLDICNSDTLCTVVGANPQRISGLTYFTVDYIKTVIT